MGIMVFLEEKGDHTNVDKQEYRVPRDRDPQRLEPEVLKQYAARDPCKFEGVVEQACLRRVRGGGFPRCVILHPVASHYGTRACMAWCVRGTACD